MKYFLLLLLVCLSGQVLSKLYSEKCNSCPEEYKVIVVGGGIGGVSTTYLLDLVANLNNQSKAGLKTISLTDVLLLEANDKLGGDIISASSSYVDPQAVQAVKQLYGYTGPFVYDLGPQRIPLLTARLQRSLEIASQTLVEGMPYTTREDSRGRIVRCPNSNFQDYSTDNPYGMASSCTSGTFGFVGNTTIPWSYNDKNGIGPAFNLSGLQSWAYVGDGGLGAMNAYLLFGGPNPSTCEDPNKSCVECQDCFLDSQLGPGKCRNHLNLFAALIDSFGEEATQLFMLDYAGFYGDFKESIFNACAWASPYWLREYDTNTVNMYPVGSFYQYLSNLAQPMINKGYVRVNSRVNYIHVHTDKTVSVSTTDGSEYHADFVVYAAQPEYLSNGAIKGNFASAMRKVPQFNSVAPISVITVSVNLKNRFWDFDLPPKVPNSTSEWTLLRSFGDQGCVPRMEIKNSPYGRTGINFRVSYTDHLCKEIFNKIVVSSNAGNMEFNNELWSLLRNDLAYIFEIPVENIDVNAQVKMQYYPNAWYYVVSNTTFSPQEIMKWSADPWGNNGPICFAQEAWAVKWFGWAEASQRTGQQCVDRMIQGSSKLLECWMDKVFPACDPVDSCYNSPDSDIKGTETLIPSKYCNERWWIYDFKQTPGCTTSVKLNPADYNKCVKQQS